MAVTVLENMFSIYFSRDFAKLDKLAPGLAQALTLHWQGRFDEAIEQYRRLIATGAFSPPTVEYELCLADQALLAVKLGRPFPADLVITDLKDPSARLIAHYARFTWGFWTNHDVASDSLRKMARLSLRTQCPESLLSVLFLFGHLRAIRSGSRTGYWLATAMHTLIFHLNKKNLVHDFLKNVVFAAYPYTLFISGRLTGGRLERTLEVGEKFVVKDDPYYQSLLLVSCLYGYAYGANVAETEIFCARFQSLHERGKMLRYSAVSEIMRLLPFALRGYGHLVEAEYQLIIDKYSAVELDPLIKSQFYRVAGVIALLLGNNARACECIQVARIERKKTNSFMAWEKFDRNIEKLAARNIPFDFTKDRLLSVRQDQTPPPQLGPVLFRLIDLLPKAVERGRDWLEDEIKILICGHLGIQDVVASREVGPNISNFPSVKIGSLFVEFVNVPESRSAYIRQILNSLATTINPYFKTYEELVEARRLERDATIVGMASETAHNILASLDALDFELNESGEDEEEQRVRRRNLVNRMKTVANGLLQRKRELSRRTNAIDQVAHTNELIPGLIDNVVTEKRVKFAHQRAVDIRWELSANSYAPYFSKLNAAEFEVTIGNVLDNAVEAVLAKGGRGQVSVNVERLKETLQVEIWDTGCGIPEHVLGGIGKPGFSHGKESGNGYGLYHALKTVESFGGTLTIDSREGQGTTLRVTLPLANAPAWFVPGLDLGKFKEVCILDDDLGAHTLWASRLNGLTLHHLHSAEELDNFLSRSSSLDEILFLFDYELSGPAHGHDRIQRTGLSLIQQHSLKNAYIVSSHYRDQEVLAECLAAGIGIIPKNFIRLVPLQMSRSTHVLIDDDSLIHQTWSAQARRLGINLKTYFSVDEFLADAAEFDKDTKIFIDSSLGNDVKGEVESLRISSLGFGEIYLTSGHPKENFTDYSHLKAVVSKRPPRELLSLREPNVLS